MVQRIRSPQEMARIFEVMNAVEKGERLVSHCVPTRAIRVVRLKGDLIFRVQQLDPDTWKWRTLSTHQGDEPWESLGPATEDSWEKQEKLKAALLRAKVEANQAERIASATRTVARNAPPELLIDDD